MEPEPSSSIHSIANAAENKLANSFIVDSAENFKSLLKSSLDLKHNLYGKFSYLFFCSTFRFTQVGCRRGDYPMIAPEAIVLQHFYAKKSPGKVRN